MAGANRKPAAANHKLLEGVVPGAFSHPQQLLAAFFTSAPIGLAIIDNKLRYQAINVHLAKMHAVPARQHIGKSIDQILGKAGAPVKRSMRQVLCTGKPTLNMEISFKLPKRKEIGYWSVTHFPIKSPSGKVEQIGAAVVEITEHKKLEKALHDLSTGLLQAQDRARRRLARELHDTAGQSLTGLVLALGALRPIVSRLGKEAHHKYSAALGLARQAANEVRTISYLLHPPMLDDMGLVETLRWYVRGFTDRSGISVKLDLPSASPRLPVEKETALFRVVQAGLQNVQQHSGSRKAEIKLRLRHSDIELWIKDFGAGRKLARNSRRPAMMGVGILGMRERLQQFGGNLEVRFGKRGTIVHATLPVSGRKNETGDNSYR